MIIDVNYPGLEEKGDFYHYDGDIRTPNELTIKIPLQCTGHVEANNIKAVGWLASFKSIMSRKNIDVGGKLYAVASITATRQIKVEDGINAGEFVRAGRCIEVSNGYIDAGGFLGAGEHITAHTFINAKGCIEATDHIIGGCAIRAGSYIRTKKFIEATGHIIAGDWIKAKEYIALNGIKSETFYNIIGKRWMITVMDTHLRIGCEFHSKEKWASFSDAEITLMGHGALTWWKNNKEWVLSLK